MIFTHCVDHKSDNFLLSKTKHGKTHLLFFLFALWPAFCQSNWFFWVKKPCLTSNTQRYVLKRVTTVRSAEKAAPRGATFMEMILAPFSFNFSVWDLFTALQLKWFCSETILAAKSTIVCYHIINHHQIIFQDGFWFVLHFLSWRSGFSHIILYQRHESIFSLRLSKQNHFPGNANQSVSPSFKVQPDALYEGLQSLIYDNCNQMVPKETTFFFHQKTKKMTISLFPSL